MSYRVNAAVEAVSAPPIADAHGWIRGRQFPADRPLLDVAQAVPSYPPAEPLLAHVAEAVKLPEASFYTPILGLPELRSSLAGFMSRAYGARVEPARVALTPGCNQAFCVVMSALAAPGDEVILPVPYYFNHQMWLDMQGVRAVHVPFVGERGAGLDLAALEAAIGPRTRALVLVTPNNPTGAVFADTALEAAYALCRARGIALVVDETYRDFLPEGTGAPHQLFGHGDWEENFVQLYSFSKVYSLTGYRVGSIIAGAALLTQVEKLLDCLTICPPRLGQIAALYGIDHLAEWRAGKRELMAGRVTALREAFRDNRLRYEMAAAGAYFAWIRHPFEGQTAGEVARRLAGRHNLLCLPGSMFGPGQEGYLRFAFGNLGAEQMPALVDRLLESQG